MTALDKPSARAELLDSSAVALVVAPEEFTPRAYIHEAPQGQTIAAMIAFAVNAGSIQLGDVDRLRVFIDGEEHELKASLDLIPPAGAMVNLNVTVHGSSARSLTQLFFAVAAVVVTFYFGPVWGSVVSLAGMVTDRVIFGSGKPDSLDAKSTGALDDTSNSYRKREPFPLVLGRQRVGLDVAALPYSQNVGDDVWLHLILGVHYGPCVIEDIRIGETLLADMPASDYQVEIFSEPGPRPITIYPARVNQENLQVELDFTGGGVWDVRTAAATTDRIEVDITFPSGLSFTNDKGKIRNEEVAGQIQYAEEGSENWINAPLPPARDKDNQPLPAGSFYVNARSANPIRRTYGFNVDKAKRWKVRVKAYDRDGDFPNEEGHTWATYWTALRSIENGAPILDETLSIIALRIKSSGELNGTLPTITAIVEPKVPIYEAGQWRDDPADYEPSSNPVALARWLLTGPAPAKPFLTSEIDASFATGYELAELHNWKGSIDVREEVTLTDAILGLGRMGRFGCYYNGTQLCLVTDWFKPAARQLFTGRNASGFRYRRTFGKMPHGVFVEFKNLSQDSASDELLVYADGYDETNAEDFVSIRLDFACEAERAFREGRVFLAKLLHQAEAFEWSAATDAIVSSYGDRVRVRHATALSGRAELRVRNRHRAGALVAGIRLSEPVVIEAGKQYAIDIRRADRVITGVPVQAVLTGLQRDLYFDAPIAAGDAPQANDLIAFGELGFVTEDLEIVDIQHEDGETTISAVRYAAEQIAAAETGPIPPLPSNITPRPGAPMPRLIGDPTGGPEGITLAFDIDPVRAGEVAGFSAFYRVTRADGTADQAGWLGLPTLPPDARAVQTPAFPVTQHEAGDVEAVVSIDIRIVTVLRNGDRSQPLIVASIPIRRLIPRPIDFFAEGVVRYAPDGTSFTAIFAGCDSIEAGVVKELRIEVAPDDGNGPDPAAWRPLGQPLPALNPAGDFLDCDAGESYAVRGRWISFDGWGSPWAVLSEGARVTVPAGGDKSSDTVNVGGVPASTLIDRLDTTEEIISSQQAAIDDLNQRVDDTETAAASAAAAAVSAANAAAAEALAEGHAEDAQSSAVAASAARDDATLAASASAASADVASARADDAGEYANAASASQTAAATSAGNANTSATQASQSATDAAGSASAASSSASNAANSATAAGGSAGAAATSASAASTSATNAGNSATAANTSRVQAESARDAASGSASAAATSASSASTSATNAGNSATAASGSATQAQTQAGNAQTFAGQASSSATNANTAAINAGVSATTAKSAAARVATASLGANPLTFGWNSYGSIPQINDLTTYVAENPANGSFVNGNFRLKGVGIYVHSVPGTVRTVLGNRYKITAQVRRIAGTEAVDAVVFASLFDANGAGLDHIAMTAVSNFAPEAGVQTIVGYLSRYGSATEHAYVNSAFIRPMLQIYGNSGASTVDLISLEIEDVTESASAAASAAAATSSAASASASAASASISANLAVNAGNLPNLLRNSDASQGLKFWDTYRFTTFYDAAYGAIFGCLGGTDSAFLVSNAVSIYENTSYTVSWVGDGGGNPAQMLMYVQYLNASGGIVQDGVAVTDFTNCSWTQRKGRSFAAPSGQGIVACKIVFSKNPATANAFVSRVMLSQGDKVVAWTDQATTRDLAASLSITAATTADLSTRMASARFEVIAAAGSDPAQLLIRADQSGSLAALVAQEIAFSNVVGGQIIRVMRLINGIVYITSKLVIGNATGARIEIDGPNQRIDIYNEAGTLKMRIGKLN